MLRLLTVLALAAPTLNSRPPDFTLKAAGGGTVGLRTLIGRERLLIAFGPDRAALQQIQAQAAEYRDRDLRLLAIVPAGSPLLRARWTAPVTLLGDPGGRVAAAYGAGTPRSFLVGKDGGIKGVYGGLPDARELFATIDGMPMRQQERRERGR